jgi:hypothetical protein
MAGNRLQLAAVPEFIVRQPELLLSKVAVVEDNS